VIDAEPVASTPADTAGTRSGVVMLCDVDLGFADATRTHSIEVARGFAAAGLDVDLVARGPDPRIDGVRYAQAHGSEDQRALRFLTINAQALWLVWRRRRTATRFYVRDSWTCMPALVAARVLGYRVVAQVDGIPYGQGNGEQAHAPLEAVKRLIAIATGRLSHGILAVTPQIKQLLVELARVPPEKITVIHNGVDVDFFTPVPREEALRRSGLDPSRRYVIFCGGFHPWTDFDALLEAFAIVAREQPDARLLMVGDGPERGMIEDTVRRLAIEDRVILTGFVHDRSRVRDYLASATVALLIYRTDKVTRTSASPIKLTEYLAAGRAVVAVEIPGVRELLGDSGAGIVVPGDPEAIARAVLELLDPERADQLGAAGRRLAQEQLSWRSVIAHTLPLFGN
jgi:glycosyltransferase involved in cell wall biosynthesis